MHDRMNQEIKAKWLDALRSGKYEQGTGALRNRFLEDEFAPTPHFAYCCLGVLCDVMEPTGWDGTVFHSFADLPPDEITLKAGLGKRESFRDRETVVSILARMNDNGTPFSEIADWIEENL